jgi:hypothetical protein
LIVQRQSNIFCYFFGLGIFMLGLMVLDAGFRRWHDQPEALQRAEIVKVLTLTDLCLVTEARYTRHPSMADLHTPFQDHPLSLEHFPSGSFIAVPPQLRGSVPK